MSRSNEYTVFHIINMEIRKVLEPKKRSVYKNAGEYLLSFYGWLDDFSKNAIRLKEDYPEAWKNYFRASYNDGLIMLNDNLVPDNNNYIFDAKFNKRRVNGKERCKATNDSKTRHKAVVALKKNLSKICGKNIKTIVHNMINNAINQLEKKGSVYNVFIEHANELREYSRNANTDDELLDVLAALLIYAQTQMLPEEPPISIDSQPDYNIFMSSKGNIQDIIPLEKRCGGARIITIVNFAGTGLIAGPIITPEVRGEWKHFFYNIPFGGTKLRIVLVDPTSNACKDAIDYKMRPLTMNKDCPIENIIPKNLATLKEYIISYPNADVDVYLTKVALPCAYMKSEFDDETKDNIKIDLYLPSFGEYSDGILQESWQCDDQLRQSFMIYRKYQKELYEVFSNNIEEIIKHSHPAFEFEKE
ncbi:hypothetical protein B5E58_11925 [Tyzzerella sp. An114]|uniref:hypothetical protein n=1 Tax=Tyzzerella sp. An114 TaxID=1965545 RepID=UPI000B44ECFD|nr:hypothetical protein [Tyzzerella sp. An114]OUQ55658.1 hypothetical protein B5E58_11925 [Tyzzerella sp. An114]